VVINPLNGITIQMMSSNGGVVQLGINIDSLSKDIFDASTLFGDISGRSANVFGVRPVHQFIRHGLFVAKTTAINRATGLPAGLARKTLAVSTKETGESTPTTARQPRLGDAPSPVISTRSMKGKFIFSGGKNDVVTYSGTIKLPPGLDIAIPHEFSM